MPPPAASLPGSRARRERRASRLLRIPPRAATRGCPAGGRAGGRAVGASSPAPKPAPSGRERLLRRTPAGRLSFVLSPEQPVAAQPITTPPPPCPPVRGNWGRSHPRPPDPRPPPADSAPSRLSLAGHFGGCSLHFSYSDLLQTPSPS
ncbi:basic proline-rich protein-like [Cynocephalus volans]|uniref:basic proline-rich protein-like n=1 Tax=Cynocephalus volans TaxID=110931 RepID=UPI002FC9B8F7